MTSSLQSTEKESLVGSGAILSNNNNNKNINNIQNNKDENISHIERVKQKRNKVLALHKNKVASSSLHNKNNNNNNNNKDLVLLNGMIDNNFGAYFSSGASSSEISNLKENDGKIQNCDTYRKVNGNEINSPILQLTANDLGGVDADFSLFTNMICNNKIDNSDGKQQLELKEQFDTNKNTDSGALDAELSFLLKEQRELEEKFESEKLIQLSNSSSDGSIVSTTSTDAILHNSLDDDDDVDVTDVT